MSSYSVWPAQDQIALRNFDYDQLSGDDDGSPQALASANRVIFCLEQMDRCAKGELPEYPEDRYREPERLPQRSSSWTWVHFDCCPRFHASAPSGRPADTRNSPIAGVVVTFMLAIVGAVSAMLYNASMKKHAALREPLLALRQHCDDAVNGYDQELQNYVNTLRGNDLNAYGQANGQRHYDTFASDRIRPYRELADTYEKLISHKEAYILRAAAIGCLAAAAIMTVGLLFSLPIQFALAAKIACLPCVVSLISFGLHQLWDTEGGLATSVMCQVAVLQKELDGSKPPRSYILTSQGFALPSG